MEIVRAPALAGIVSLGVLVIDGVVNRAADAGLDGPLAAAEAAVRGRPPQPSPAVRAMYRRTGLDPTRTRPSSEALLRRVIKGQGLPRISTLVDVCNWCSLEFQLPYGLYDMAAVRPPVELRLGRPDEEYPGIRKDVVHVAGRLTLADAIGPFGNPTSDSARTMVTEATRTVLVAIFAPAALTAASLDAVLDATLARTTAYAGGRLALRAVI